MSKPTNVPHWADSPTTLRTEPSTALKNAGFTVSTKLPAQYFNWLFGIVTDWIVWLNTRIFDAKTIPTSGIDVQLTATSGKMRVENASGTLQQVDIGDATAGVMATALNQSAHQKDHRRVSAHYSGSISSGTPTTISFADTYWQTTDGMWNAGQPTRLVAEIAGEYEVTARVHFAGHSGGTRVASINYSGSGPGSDTATQDASTNSNDILLSCHMHLETGEYATVQVTQDSTVSLATTVLATMQRLPGPAVY